MISYFTFECRSCVNLFSTLIGLKTCSGLTCTDSLHFKKKNQKISHCGSRFPKHVVLGQFTHVGLLLGVEQPPHKPIVFMVFLVLLSFCSLLFTSGLSSTPSKSLILCNMPDFWRPESSSSLGRGITIIPYFTIPLIYF